MILAMVKINEFVEWKLQPMRWTVVTELGMREKPCCCPVNMKEL
jgi:hypothetical protein